MEKLHESFEDYINENSTNQEIENIRHFKGSVEDLVNFFQSRSEGGDVNNGEPTRQGYKVHPTREETQSPHWDEITESIVGYNQIGSDERYLVYNIKGLVDLGRKVKINLVSIMDEDTYFPCIVNLTKKKPLFRNLNNNEIENLKKGKFFEKEETQSPHWSEVNEAAKIACIECDEVNTRAAWKKNGGFCPSCNSSTQGVAESVNEADFGKPANGDYSDEMSFGQLERCIDYSTMIRERIQAGTSLDPWMHSQIAVAENELNSVFDALDGDDGIVEAVTNVKVGDLVAHDKTGERYKVISKPSKTKIVGKNKKGEERVLSTHHITMIDVETVNEFGPMMGSGNHKSESRDLVNKISLLDKILNQTKNRKAEEEWAKQSEDFFSDNRSYWSELKDSELKYAIETAERLIKWHKIKI